MRPAVPGILSVKRAVNVAVALVAAALVSSACAPQSAPPNIPVNFQGASYLTQVVDQVYDVGRSPSVTLDKDGNPSATYLLLAPQLAKGAIPPPLLANTPQPPSVVIASQADGVWTRRNVTPNASGGGKGTATEIADKDGLYDGQSTVAMAVDPNGFHHVVWSTPSGLFYAKDDTVQLQGDTTTLAFNGPPTQIVKKAVSGASIAVSDNGTPWLAFISDGKVQVASLSGSTWTVEDVDQAPGTPSPANRTAITVVSGNPIVAYPGAAGVTVATRTAPPATSGSVAPGTAPAWTFETVPGSGGALGLSMTQSSSQPVLSFISGSGDVDVAAASGGAWKVAKVGNVGKTPTGEDVSAFTTGLGADANGNLAVAWPDMGEQFIEVAQGTVSDLTFTASPLAESTGGWSPSLAVSPDGKHAAVAWYDSINKHLNVATLVQGTPQIAIPSPLFSQLPTPTAPGQLPCFPTGSTSLTLTAPSGAAGTGFSTKCLAVRPGDAFTVAFSNQDQAPHNFAIYTDSQATKLLGGATSATDIVPPGAGATYQVKGLPEGTYFFRCDVHPTTMTGTFVVTAKKALNPTPSPSASPTA
jgi:plastocyanin